MKITQETILKNNNLIIDINISGDKKSCIYYTIILLINNTIQKKKIDIISLNKETIRDSILIMIDMLTLTGYLNDDDTSTYNEILQETYDVLGIDRDCMDNSDYEYKGCINDIKNENILNEATNK